MTGQMSQLRTAWIYRYSIGSSDMFFEEVQQRDVFVRDDPEKGFQIWGQIVNAGPATSVSICEMFLEYALYCHAWCSTDEAIFYMKDFGNKIGAALAKFVQNSAMLEKNKTPGVCTLMCLWESMHIQFTVEHIGAEMHFMFANCPLDEAAHRSGIHDVGLALYGVNALCQALIHTIDPQMEILTQLEERPNFEFSVKEAVG